MPQQPKIQTVALSRNKMYKTYQFHGVLGRGKNPELVMQQAVKEIFLWLQSRFRQFDSIPEEIRIPNDKSQLHKLLKSFRINDGYVIETVYLPERKIWTFRLTEPDMGTSTRPALPGRIFMTNYGLAIVGGMVEFGSQTVCSQPEEINKDAEVFRPKLIRDLRNELGIYSIVDLTYEAGDLSEPASAKRYRSIIGHKYRNMPVIIIDKKLTDIKDINLPLTNPYMSNIESAPDAGLSYRDIANKWAKSLCGIAYVFLNEQAAEHGVTIIFSNQQSITLGYGEILDSDNNDIIWKKVKKEATNHSKRNDHYQFGHVIFLNEAIALKNKDELDRLQESDGFDKEIQALKGRINFLEEEVVREEQLTRDFSRKYQGQKEQRIQEEACYRDQKRHLMQQIESLNKQLENSHRRLDQQAEIIKEYQAKEDRPKDISGFIRWVETHHASDIILTSKAKRDLRKAQNNCDIDAMCDGIEILAKVYKKWRVGTIAEEEYTIGCKSLMKTSFSITPSGDASISRYAEHYKVDYGDGPRSKTNRRALDQHLKSGIDSRSLIRIYFFWDAEKELVVIGSMPDHLPSVSG